MFRQYCLSHTHNLIRSFKYSVFAASRWPVLPKHVGRVPGINSLLWLSALRVSDFRRVRTIAKSFVMSVRSSSWNKSVRTGWIFVKSVI